MKYRVRVSCDDPLNQLSRIIDILRRMDATLVSLDLSMLAEEEYEAAIEYALDLPMRAETFLARLVLVPGIDVLESFAPIHLVSSDRQASSAVG